MLKLIDKGPDGNGNPVTTGFIHGDIINVERNSDGISITVSRKNTIIFLGENHNISLHTFSKITARQAWPIINLILEANWILADVFEESNTGLYAVVRRIATCQIEMDRRLPSGNAGGDGYGRD